MHLLASVISSFAMLMTSALFWDITQRRIVIVYRSTLCNIPEEPRMLALSVRRERCDSHLSDLREMRYLGFLCKVVETF
jgi:hypothetical protein